MVGDCRCLKENLDELRIERVCYGRVTGKPELILDETRGARNLRRQLLKPGVAVEKLTFRPKQPKLGG
jgi:hypothetical protein